MNFYETYLKKIVFEFCKLKSDIYFQVSFTIVVLASFWSLNIDLASIISLLSPNLHT